MRLGQCWRYIAKVCLRLADELQKSRNCSPDLEVTGTHMDNAAGGESLSQEYKYILKNLRVIEAKTRTIDLL